MSGYVKKIAIIKQLKGGFSADGGALSGLVKAESYAGFLKVEVSLINFAPLAEGRYVYGITDGLNTIVFDTPAFEGEGDFNLSCGFAFLVCFCHGKTAPVASASCGQMACALPDLKEEMCRSESKPKKGGAAYDDEAIAENNYYEQFKADEGGDSVRPSEEEEENERTGDKNEAHTRTVEGKADGGVNGVESGANETDGGKNGADGTLAGGDFYSRMQGEIERIFSVYPREKELECAMQGSRFVKINYGTEGRYYVFGVLNVDGAPRYICYGVPSPNPALPPISLSGCSSYVPTRGGGYWMVFQDASTGVSIKLTPT